MRIRIDTGYLSCSIGDDSVVALDEALDLVRKALVGVGYSIDSDLIITELEGG